MTKKNKIKVLIIDDNYSILQYLKTLMERYNFEVKTSLNGFDGLQDSAEYKPDIIFLDLMMPNIDGIKMLQLKKVLNDIKDIPVVVISANAGRNNVLAAIEAGAERVLAKPINVKQLKATVNEVMGYDCFQTEESFEENIIVKDEAGQNEIVEKYEEYKIVLIEAIKGREPKTLKDTAELLVGYCDNNSRSIVKDLLFDIKKKDYQKPSDWMFADLVIKQIEHELYKPKFINRE